MNNKSKTLTTLIPEPSEQDDQIVSVELTDDQLQRYSLLERETIKDLRLLSIVNQTLISRNKEKVAFTSGAEYRINKIGMRDIIIIGPNGECCEVPNLFIEGYFTLRIPEVRRNALEKRIDQILKETDEKLDVLAKRFLAKDTFKIGDKVIWKEGLKNAIRPLMNETAIVIEIVDPPVTCRVDRKDQDLTQAGGVSDIVIAVLDQDNEFRHYLMDSRRFRKV